ncbi:MAG TPA: DUF2232 domain-containing protein, partial [Acidimicrobiales bacterium]|nr:DUF2232 domain-containing protein [Acidimicrobiales bacterium]
MRIPGAPGAPGAIRPATATGDPAARHADGEPAGAADGAGPAGSPSPGGDAASPAPTGPVRAPSGPLQPIELATASVLAGVPVILVLAGWLIPHASGLIGLAVVPMAVVAHRHRPRAVVASTVAAGTVSFLVAGTGPLPTIALCAIVGGIAGHAHRRQWRWPTVLAAALLAGPALGGFIDLALLAFAPLRRLTLTDARNTWDGYARLVGRIPSLQPVAHQATLVVHAVLQYWWATILVAVVVVCLVATWATWYYARGLLYRLQRVPVEDRLAASPEAAPAAAGLPAAGGGGPGAGGSPAAGGGVAAWPVPVQLDGVRVRYPGAAGEALAGVSLTISPRERTVVLG